MSALVSREVSGCKRNQLSLRALSTSLVWMAYWRMRLAIVLALMPAALAAARYRLEPASSEMMRARSAPHSSEPSAYSTWRARTHPERRRREAYSDSDITVWPWVTKVPASAVVTLARVWPSSWAMPDIMPLCRSTTLRRVSSERGAMMSVIAAMDAASKCGQSPGYSRTRRSSGHSLDRKSTRLNSSHQIISYAVF